MSCSCWCWNMVVSACDVPCMHAFFYIYGHLEVVRLLLQSGADKECNSLDDARSLSLVLVHLFLLCASFISHVVHCNKIV